MAILRLTAIVVAIGLALAAAPQAAEEDVLRMPAMPQWKLLSKVDPKYPPAALRQRIEGAVRFEAVIGKDGHIERLRLVSGHPLYEQPEKPPSIGSTAQPYCVANQFGWSQ
jgi:outer membrane biosynthesis protein TonB